MKIFVRLLVLAVFGLLIYALFYGPLFFLNPIKIEYEQVKGERSVVYTRDIIKLEAFYYEVETDMAQAEELYGLRYHQNPTIIVTLDTSEFARFVPWISNKESLEATALQLGNVIYINSAKIKRQKYHEHEFLRNELVRNLLYQNSIFFNRLVIDNQKWFSEGVAAYFGGPYYLSDLEFRVQFEEKNPSYNMQRKQLFTNLGNDPEFASSLYRLFIKYIIETYGKKNFLVFMNGYLDSPSNFQTIFYESYQKKMIVVTDEFISQYK